MDFDERSLFDDIERSDARSRFNGEPHFAYLNVSARLSADRVRALTDSWYLDIPHEARKDLRGRFRSSDDIVHVAAYMELYCAALLRGHGFGVEVHPSPSSRGTYIDFLAKKGEDPAFVLECVTSGDREDAVWENSLIRRFYDSLNELRHPDLFVMAQFKQAGSQPPSGRRARGFLQQLLATVDWQWLWTTFTTGDEGSNPQWVWRDSGWEIQFVPIPKAPELRGITDINMVSIQMDRVRSSQPGEGWLRPLERKASRYGKPDLPYVVAVNGVGMFHFKSSIPIALFGQPAVTIHRETGKTSPGWNLNGLWVGPNGPKHRQVSAVLFAEHLTPWSVSDCNLELWHNPWADKPLDANWLTEQYIHDTAASKMRRVEGSKGAALFDLEPAWPGED